MKWLLPLLAFAMACGNEEDDRPLHADYIITTILAPTCGRGGCHSEGTKTQGYAFDTLEGAKLSLLDLVEPGNVNRSSLYDVLTETEYAMPPEGPLPTPDIDYIARWIGSGAEGL
jgi:hypothetical protein